jgi:ribosome-associated protein YbcJ (S4-like RNA binding protein)
MRGKKLRQGDCAEYERIIYDVKWFKEAVKYDG